MLINGDHVTARSGQWIDVENPGDMTVVGRVPRGQETDVDAAVAAAAAAFPGWRDTKPRDRGRMLAAAAADIAREAEEIATTLALETGNAIRTQSRPEVKFSAEFFEYFGALASEFKGEVIPQGPDLLNYNTREPYGVVGGIVPWNSPVMLAATKIAMAASAGNTVVIKAPEDAPLAVLRIGEIAQRYLPAGVVNVVTGYGEEAGRAMVRHPGVAKISFTGSTEVGREIGRVAGERIMPIVLELGGKSPAIVYPDSDSDAVADGVIAGMRFTRQGQGCTAGSRLFVHEDIFDSFIARLSRRLSALRIGDALDEATDVGAIINKKQYDRVCDYIKDGLSAGATAVLGGSTGPDPDLPPNGFFLKPTIFTQVQPDWRITREEIFGPVLVALPWSSEDEAIAMANDTHYGLSAYVWCRDISRAVRAASRIEAGGVQINRGFGPVPGMSDGGIKESGYGREHSLEGAIDDFTYRKSMVVAL